MRGSGSIFKRWPVLPLAIVQFNAYLKSGIKGVKGHSFIRFYDVKNKKLLEYKSKAIDSLTYQQIGNYTESPANARYMEIGIERDSSAAGYIYADDFSIESNVGAPKTNHQPTVNLDQYMCPFWRSNTIYNETVLLYSVKGKAADGKLLYQPDHILSVKSFDLHTTYTSGKDYTLNGNVIERSPNSAMPYRADTSFDTKKDLAWFDTQSQWVVITYTHHDKWTGPIPVYKGAQMPNTLAKLHAKKPLKIVAFGMSITRGMDVSSYDTVPPYMPTYVDLFARQLRKAYHLLGSKNVVMYVATINSDESRTLSIATAINYTPGKLAVEITKDENWVSATSGVLGTTEEYRDLHDRVVLKRTYNINSVTNNTDEYSTYYVYDDFGNLAFVIPPNASPDAGTTIPQTTLDNLCYQYRYDQKNRLTQKKMPGKGWEFVVYNNIDEVVMTQDANQRNQTLQQWTFTKYDAMGRVAMTGIYLYPGSTADTSKNNPSRAEVQGLQGVYAGTTAPLWESRDNTQTTGYNNASLPLGTGYTFYATNFYDDYTSPTSKIPPAFTLSTASKMMRGELTASFVNILTTSNMLCTVDFFDDFGRTVETFSQHYLGGTLSTSNYDLVTNTYNFDNSLNTLQRDHYTFAGGSTAIVTMLNTYVYDLIGRQKQLKKRINSPTDLLLSQFDYNELGQLITKHLHSTNGGTSFLQNTGYTYNERGWLSKINDPSTVSATQVFGMQLYYGDNPTTAQKTYNGNIGTAKWQTLSPSGSGITQQIQTFDYTYDNLNRLTKAQYSDATPADAGAYNESLSYDKMGNISTLNRFAKSPGIVQIDQLQYTYLNAGISNQLNSVNDAIATTYPFGQPSGTANYGYDKNGNQTTDSKKATTITYNYLNLPQNITQTGNSNQLNFVYTAAGRKLRKIYGTATRDYDDGIEYSNGSIEFINTEEGRSTPGTNYAYEYFIKDHLGNTRATVKQDGNIYQLQNYYAFGMDIPVSTATTPDNRYKYNDKELETEMSLNEYDYGARFYDPIIGRWTTLDPLSEKDRPRTPYNYAFNNPLIIIDPNGMFGDYYKMDGTYLGSDGVDDDKVYAVDNDAVVVSTNKDGWTTNIFDKNKVTDITEKYGITYSDFKDLAGTIYGEMGKKSTSWKEGAGIFDVIKNRSNLEDDKSIWDEAQKGGIYGWKHKDLIFNKFAGKLKVQAAFRATLTGITSNVDYSNGAYFWQGVDFHKHFKGMVAYETFYLTGFHFTRPEDDIYCMGDHNSGAIDYKYRYQSTGAEEGTTFFKYTEEYKNATQHPKQWP